MRTEPTPEKLSQRLHQHYDETFVGDGVTTQFFLQHTIQRLGDVTVSVAGVRMRVSDRGTAHDYKVRGLTPGYAGDRNAITFTAAPAAGKDILVSVVSV